MGRCIASLTALIAVLLSCSCGGGTPTAPALPPSINSTFLLEGRVYEAPPGQPSGRPLAGVRVEVFTKRGLYATAVTNAEGLYRLDGLAGSFDLSVHHNGFQPNITAIRNLNAPRRVDVGLVPVTQRITGVVLEAPPARNRPIAGARLTVISGSSTGATAVSDDRGRYALDLMGGQMDLRVEHAGYGSTSVRLRLDGLFWEVNVLMAPAPDVVRTLINIEGTVRVLVNVRSHGELAIVDWSGYGFEQGDGYTLQIWEGGRMLAQAFAERSFPADTIVLRVAVTPDRTYEVRTVETPLLPYRISVRYPS